MHAVIDLETTTHSPISSTSFPMWPMNEVVLVGVRYNSVNYISKPLIDADWAKGTSHKDDAMGKHYFNTASDNKDVDTLVGHNIKFDLLYALRNGWISPTRLMELKVWDTQLAEYLLSGQTRTYPALDDLSEKYGGTKKDDKIKEYFELKIPTECIPASELRDYLRGDLENTEIVYKKQLAIATKWGMMKLIESQMRCLQAITIMEWNGMKVDTGYVDTRLLSLKDNIDIEQSLLSSSLCKYVDANLIYSDWDWSSPKDVSNLLFGGYIKTNVKKLVGKYKNGKDKYKAEVETWHYKGMQLDPAKFGASITKLSTFTVDDVVLKNIDNEVTQSVLKLRELTKQKSTYFENLKGLITPYKFVHPNLSMVSTKTGRLSCNKPNIQNQTTIGGIKNSYVSRWGDGLLVEMDFSQLEMVGLAIVSDCKQLQQDISDGVDTHKELYKKMYGRAPTAAERKAFKPLTFGLVYGAGAKTLSEQGGCSIADAKKFIEVFYDRYKGVKLWHDSMVQLAEKNKAVTTKHTGKGMPMHAYLHRMPTGRMYVFNTYDNEWKPEPSFSPTELKNWPIQGFSTGDIVPHMVGEVTETIYKARDDSGRNIGQFLIPIMTVHDSILFDCRGEEYLKYAKAIRDMILNNTSSCIEHHFGIPMPVKLKVGMSVGKTWGDMEDVSTGS